MSDLIDKKALIVELDKVHSKLCLYGVQEYPRFREFCNKVWGGVFDAKPEPITLEIDQIQKDVAMLKGFMDAQSDFINPFLSDRTKEVAANLKRQSVLNQEQMQRVLKDLNGGMGPEDKRSIHSRVMEIERNKADAFSLSGKAGDEIREGIDNLKKRVDRIEHDHKIEDLKREYEAIDPSRLFNEMADAWLNKTCSSCKHHPAGSFGITTRCVGCAATNFRNWECKS